MNSSYFILKLWLLFRKLWIKRKINQLFNMIEMEQNSLIFQSRIIVSILQSHLYHIVIIIEMLFFWITSFMIFIFCLWGLLFFSCRLWSIFVSHHQMSYIKNGFPSFCNFFLWPLYLFLILFDFFCKICTL